MPKILESLPYLYTMAWGCSQNISKFIKDIKTGFSKQKHDDGDDNQDEDGNLDDDFCDYDNDDILE